jgi:hypothetical protein
MHFESHFPIFCRLRFAMGLFTCALSLQAMATEPPRTDKFKIKGRSCETLFPLSEGRQFAVCGPALYITPGKGGAAQAKPVGHLRDDQVWAVRELPLSPVVPIGTDTLTSLVLVDTGNELCYGTMVMGLLSSGATKQWGTLDQVLEHEENVDCLASALKLSNAAGEVSLKLPAEHSTPTPDGAYKRVHRAVVLPIVSSGQFCRKGKACGKGAVK